MRGNYILFYFIKNREQKQKAYVLTTVTSIR